MSRTKSTGGKGPGYEFWGRRNTKLRDPGRVTKTHTHRLERRKGKRTAGEQAGKEGE